MKLLFTMTFNFLPGHVRFAPQFVQYVGLSELDFHIWNANWPVKCEAKIVAYGGQFCTLVTRRYTREGRSGLGSGLGKDRLALGLGLGLWLGLIVALTLTLLLKYTFYSSSHDQFCTSVLVPHAILFIRACSFCPRVCPIWRTSIFFLAVESHLATMPPSS